MSQFFQTEDFLRRLDEVRQKSGLSKGEFGKKIGVQNVFARYASPKPGQTDRKIKSPSVETLLSIADQFDVDVTWLLTGREQSPALTGAFGLPAWLQELLPRLSELDDKGQAAARGALVGVLDALLPMPDEEETKPPPQNVAAGPARARRR